MVRAEELELLLEFLNTWHVHAADGSHDEAFRDDAGYRRWLAEQGLPDDPGGAARARRVRDALRAAAGGEPVGADALDEVPLRVRLTGEGPEPTGEGPLGVVLGVAVRLAAQGGWDRVKLCRADSCRWAFYDGSRNRSGRWCSMAACGNRAKTRAFRERRRGDG